MSYVYRMIRTRDSRSYELEQLTFNDAMESFLYILSSAATHKYKSGFHFFHSPPSSASPLRPLLGERPPCDTPPSPWPRGDPRLLLAPQYYCAQGRLAADRDRLGHRHRSHGFWDIFINKPRASSRTLSARDTLTLFL
jgi:hypothetical protein